MMLCLSRFHIAGLVMTATGSIFSISRDRQKGPLVN
jgi:hypothetical protein